jgi:membrane-bound inhibitor of C-type lysozyme
MRFAVIFAVLALASCQTPCPGPDTGPTNVTFRCEDGSTLLVTFNGAQGAARVAQEGYTAVDLPARIVASGYRYADDGVELRGRGAEAQWTRPGAAETLCQETD